MAKEKLDGNKLDGAAGGYIFNAKDGAGVREKPFEVIDDKDGSVLGRYKSKKEACKMAKAKSQSQEEIRSWDELNRLRKVQSPIQSPIIKPWWRN